MNAPNPNPSLNHYLTRHNHDHFPPIFEALTPRPYCLCHNVPIGEPLEHWCGWPAPCCIARRGKHWKHTKNLDHLRICHERCWMRDAVEVVRRERSRGRSVDQPGHLRLCHRRCYVNDLIRSQKYQLTHTVEPPDERREVVPCNRSRAEMLRLPQLQHWVVRLSMEGDEWEVPREDFPWPLTPWRFRGRRVLRMRGGGEQRGRGREEKRGDAGEGRG